MGSVISDQGFLIADLILEKPIINIPHLIATLSCIPGLIEHGIFDNYATKIIVGRADSRVSFLL